MRDRNNWLAVAFCIGIIAAAFFLSHLVSNGKLHP